MPIVALPAAHTKAWQWVFNQAVTTGGTSVADHKANALKLKNLMIGMALSPWTVSGSSNSVAAGMDGVDRWVTSANIVAANEGTAHSWIVLRQTGVGQTFEFLFNFGKTNANAAQADMMVSAVGFTGGSITARPTALDEAYLTDSNLNGGAPWFNNSGSGFSTRWNIHQTTDGSQTRLIVFQAGTPVFFLSFDKLTGARTGITNPWAATWSSGSTSDCLTSSITTGGGTGAPACRVRGIPRTRPARLAFVFGQTDGRPDPTTMGTNGISGERPFWSMVVHSLTHRSHMGTIADMFQGNSGIVTADGAPAAGPRIWQAYSMLLLTHDGTIGNPNGTALVTT